MKIRANNPYIRTVKRVGNHPRIVTTLTKIWPSNEHLDMPPRYSHTFLEPQPGPKRATRPAPVEHPVENIVNPVERVASMHVAKDNRY